MKLQLSPLGLLELFRLKQLGQNPAQFDDKVSPSVDVTDFYGCQSAVVIGQNGAAGVITQGQSTASALTARRYLAMSGVVTIGAAAGGYLTLALGYFFESTGAAVYVQTQSFTPVIGGIYRVGVLMEGLILPPGHFLGFVVNGNAAGTDHVPQLAYSYQRLDGLP